jgi:hypothetical protein
MNARAQDQETREPETGASDSAAEFDSLLRKPASQPSHAARLMSPPARERSDSGAAHTGRITSIDAEGTVCVLVPGWLQPIEARLATALTREQVTGAIATQQPVVLLFENADPLRPIIVGLLESKPRDADPQPGRSPVVEADVDGKRVRVTAEDEIVLQCGQSSITLRRNGRVIIRGTHVESVSDGTNRIRGGQVRIN